MLSFSIDVYFTSSQFNSKMKVFVSLLFVAAAVSGAPSANHLGLIGGTDAELGQYPYLVSLKINNTGFDQDEVYKSSCGGLIINENTIVTAARCLVAVPENRKVYAIKAGIVDLYSKDVQEIEIARVLVHPDFDTSRNEKGLYSLNDIALITLASNLTFNDNVKAIALPEQDAVVADGASGQFAGWGAYYFHSRWYHPNIAQSITYTTTSYAECKAALVDTLTDDPLLDEKLTLCVGSLVGRNGPLTSIGDEGSPFVVNGVAVGILSWYPLEFRHADSKRPAGGIFTKLSPYVDWINKNVQ